MFEDLYEWAGQFRNINISKKGTDFADFKQIESLMTNCMKRLSDMNFFQNLSLKDFVENIADFYYTTNIIHPFREGNGRTQRIFISQLIHYNGYEFDFSDIDSDDLMIATIQSANGVRDYLIELFMKNIK